MESFIFINLLRNYAALLTWILILSRIAVFALSGSFSLYYAKVVITNEATTSKSFNWKNS